MRGPWGLLVSGRGPTVAALARAAARVLAAIREKRALDMGAAEVTYAALPHVQEELRFCHAIYRTPPEWPVIDVTGKSIEEVAAAVCALTVDAPAP